MRARATVILKHDGCILLVREKNGKWLLPGGKIENNELPISAAIRELYEETSLIATSIIFLFEHKSFSNFHVVFSATVLETASIKATNEITDIQWVRLNDISNMDTTPATKKILDMAMENSQSEESKYVSEGS